MHIDVPCCIIVPLIVVGGVVLVRGNRLPRRREGWGDDAMTVSCCPRCGHTVVGRPGARFCPQCGAPLDV
ncbi:MAG: zinc-ribbon domain-containing protein [Phycisphaerae bacterium]|nr:zinc-ribbon domain-containing protein [Phycisphaerae bacterium]